MLTIWLQEHDDKDTAIDDSVKKRKEVESSVGVGKEHATETKVSCWCKNLPVLIVNCDLSLLLLVFGTYSKG